MRARGTVVAQTEGVNVLDAIIIYLSLGAPFGVYYFLRQRERYTGKPLWVKTILTCALWPFEAVKLIQLRSARTKGASELHFDGEHLLDARAEKRVSEIQRIFEDRIFVSDTTASVYEFREAFERYTGLTRALMPGPLPENIPEAEIFRIAEHKNAQIGSVCLNRRNRSRLLSHQNQAREDLLRMLARVSTFPESEENVEPLAQELADILKDAAAGPEIKSILGQLPQIEDPPSVKESGRELWKPEIREQLPTRLVSINLPSVQARATLRRDD